MEAAEKVIAEDRSTVECGLVYVVINSVHCNCIFHPITVAGIIFFVIFAA